MAEARNLRNMTIAQTPLLGDENTPLHAEPGGGTGFEGATPRHQVAFTPNPLATPVKRGEAFIGDTPRSDMTGATPLRTPLRDTLRLNPQDAAELSSAEKRALRAGLMSLPKPENNFELLLPDEEEEVAEEDAVLGEEDAAERDAKLQRQREAEERRELARRSQAVQLNLPRPANVNVQRLLQDLSLYGDDESDVGAAQRLVDLEMAGILQHDAIAFPLPGTTVPGATRSTYEMPEDEYIAEAKAVIHRELAASLGFPNANEEQVREGLVALATSEDVDERGLWPSVRAQLVFDTTHQQWAEPSTLSQEQLIASYSALLDEDRDVMSKEANKAAQGEKTLGKLLGGYQALQKKHSERITAAFDDLQKTRTDLESFIMLQANEQAAGPRRLEVLQDEVTKLELREKTLQEQYRELEAERAASQERVAALEDKVMAEAEALNEEALAAMEDN